MPDQLPNQPATPPDPVPDAAEPRPPTRSSRLLNVIRKIIDYSKGVVSDLRQYGVDDWTAARFGTPLLALIVHRLTIGLQRAAAFEARIVRSATRLDRWSIAMIGLPRSASATPARKPAQREEGDSLLARVPTSAAIALDLRHRPIHEVLVDICLDLGIPMWPELQDVIFENNGGLVRYVKGMFKPRLYETFVEPLPEAAPEAESSHVGTAPKVEAPETPVHGDPSAVSEPTPDLPATPKVPRPLTGRRAARAARMAADDAKRRHATHRIHPP